MTTGDYPDRFGDVSEWTVWCADPIELVILESDLFPRAVAILPQSVSQPTTEWDHRLKLTLYVETLLYAYGTEGVTPHHLLQSLTGLMDVETFQTIETALLITGRVRKSATRLYWASGPPVDYHDDVWTWYRALRKG